MICAFHPDRTTTEICYECGRGICSECQTVIAGKKICPSCLPEPESAVDTMRTAQVLEVRGNVESRDSEKVSAPVQLLLGLVTFFLPPLGLLIGAVFYNNPNPEFRNFGKRLIIIGSVYFLFSILVVVFLIFAFSSVLLEQFLIPQYY